MAITAAERALVRRPALEERLDETFGRRLTLVVAEAGYGKSTLVAQWSEELERAWHTVSTSDLQLSALAAGLAAALRPWLGELPEGFQATLAGGHDELARAEVVAGQLSEALGRKLSHDIVLVLDDAQTLSSSPASLRLLESLCRQAPATLHLVVLSREALELRIDRLRAQGLVLEVASADLAFSRTEIQELSQVLVGTDTDLAERIEALTGGWPAAVRLALEALGGVAPEELGQALAAAGKPGTPLFRYLAREVFERESPEVRELIRTVAPLERFTLPLCEALGLAQASESVAALVQRGLFVQRHQGVFTLHALVREFARVAWPLTREEEQSVHLETAEWCEREGRFHDAGQAYAAAANDQELARMLVAHGQDMLGSGDAATIIDLAGRLSSQHRDEAVERLLGEALVLRGDFDRAVASYERAAAGADALDAGLAWRLGVAHYFRGDLDEAFASFARASPQREGTADDALLLAWTSSAHWLSGNASEAGELAARALKIAHEVGDKRALAASCIAVDAVSGLEGNPRRLDEALEAAEESRDFVLLRRTRVNRASMLTERGAYELALEEVNEAFELSQAGGLDFAERALTNRGGIHLRLGLLDNAHADYRAVVEHSRRSGSTERRYGYLGIGDVHRERGSVALARAAYEQGLQERGDHIHALVMALQGVARVLVDEDPVACRRAVTQATETDSMHRAWALNGAGWVALALNARDDAADAAVEAQRHARERGDTHALAEAFELEVFAGEDPALALARLEDALAIWRELGCRVRIAECELALARLATGPRASAAEDRALSALRAFGVRVSPAGPAGLLRTIAQAPPDPLVVQVLGGFRVLRQGIPLTPASWQSKRARDLLKILVTRRGRPVPRDVLMDALWPDENAEKLPNRLSVALSTLRSVLDPDGNFDPEHFVKADRTSVTLDVNSVVVDVEVFLHQADAGAALRAEGRPVEAREWLTQAESAYAGDALEDDPYSDWAVSLREEALATYVSVAQALAEDAVAAGEDEAASRYLLRILGHDPYDERAHLALVSVMERSGRRGRARQAYSTYVARMEEIGATPAAFPDVSP